MCYKDRVCPCCGGRVYADGLAYNRILWRCIKCPYEKVESE